MHLAEQDITVCELFPFTQKREKAVVRRRRGRLIAEACRHRTPPAHEEDFAVCRAGGAQVCGPADS